MTELPHEAPAPIKLDTRSSAGNMISEQQTSTASMAVEMPPPAADDMLSAGSEITHLYLTFDTSLPPPNTTKPSSPSSSPAPAPPNLIPYTNPVLWSSSKKHLMLALSCIATFLTAYTSGSYSPPAHLMREDMGASSNVAVLTGITSFCLGFGFAPMFLAPFSEMNGRYPVFVVSGIVYVVFQAVCGVVRSLAGMIVARAFVGIGASVFSTMVGGVIADMWGKEGRNTPMALFSGSVLAGTGAGPLVGAVMAYWMDDDIFDNGVGNVGVEAPWKWIFWHQVIMGVVLMVALVVLFKESRGSVLLSRKARALNKWYEELEKAGCYGVFLAGEAGDGDGDDTGRSGPADELKTKLPTSSTSLEEGGSSTDEETGSIMGTGVEQDDDPTPTSNNTTTKTSLKRIRWKVKEDEERSSIVKMITVSVTRPFGMLFTEPVVFFFSLWVAFAWGVLYLTFGSIPLVFRRQYGWDLEKSGLVFVSLIIGAILATSIGIWQEKVLHHPQWTSPLKEMAIDNSSSSDIEQQQQQQQALTHTTSHNENNYNIAPSDNSPFWTFIRRHFPADAPESRLYFTCLTSTLLPIGMFIFGFTAQPNIPWIAPAIGITLATMGILSIYLAVFNYLADTYHKYASSALAAQSLCRNILGGVFPLVTHALFVNLGEARAAGLLGGIATALTVVPWVLVFFGERIRARSPFATQLKMV
ncbi:major facilitator superfamily domain-containing protein [Apodospora peruviana]|uniref:Major facilitator superfamily domain-containing protein n=1 Tax=Apodospora peruviana TaxID=516989 RepID=A0AAE0LZ08_9PEZI|nr:major facilitator superfamily domain-containing protein [Apodospora peruviana]